MCKPPQAQPNQPVYGAFCEAMFKGLEAAWTAAQTLEEAAALIEVAYTGWRFTTQNFELLCQLPATVLLVLCGFDHGALCLVTAEFSDRTRMRRFWPLT